jgi:hypothetical protein
LVVCVRMMEVEGGEGGDVKVEVVEVKVEVEVKGT